MATPSFDEDTAEEVLRQVEYYFSDSNLSRDKFLSKTITSSEDGLVSLALICSFEKMKAHLNLGQVKQEDIADDTLKAVAQTLRNSASLKLSGDGRKVGRVSPLLNSEEIADKLDQRTVAVSPLPFDIDQESLQFFFSQHGKVNSVRLPKHIANTNEFCGTALVEFSSDEEVQKILSQSFTIGSLQLELKPKKEFDAERAQKSKDFKAANSQLDAKHKENSSTKAYYIKGLIVGFQLKSILRGDQAEHNDKQESGKDDGTDTKEADKTTEDSQGKVPEDANNKEEIVAMETEKVNKEKDIENKEEISFDEEELSKDSAGKDAKKERKDDLAACKDDKNVMTREDLKVVFSKFGKVKIGEDSGYVRFHRPDGAEKARAAAVLAKEEGLVVKNFIATLEPLTGDAEKEYWMRLRENKDKHRQKRGSKLIRGGKRHRSRDTDSVRGGKRHRLRDTDSVRGGKRHRSRDTVSVRGGKRHRSRDTDSVRGGRNKSQKVNSVRLPKHIANTDAFCGTALVEFSSDEEVQKILGQSLTIGSLQLELKPKKEFDAERAQKSKDFEAANSQLDAKHKENSSTKAYYIKGLIVGFQLKSILRGDQAEHNDKQESGKDDRTDTKEADKPLTSMDKTTEDSQGKVPEDTNNKEEIVALETEKVNEEKDIEKKEEISFDEEELSKNSAGKVAKEKRKYDLAACKDEKNVMTRKNLKVAFSKFGEVKYIDFRIGEDSGYVIFHRPDGAEKACAAAVLAKEEGLVVKNFIATLEPLTGDAEKEYWMRLLENKEKHSLKRGRQAHQRW
ncbi:La protein 1 [Linum perenne]